MSKTFVPTRRGIRNAETVFEQSNGLWTIIEVHSRGSPKRLVYTNQSRRAAQACIVRALNEGQHIIVWGDLSTPTAALLPQDVPLLAWEVGSIAETIRQEATE